jgi:fucose 4-O-acetylase-like acetyltransferase
MLTTTLKSARISGFLFAGMALISCVGVDMAKQSILVPMMSFIGYGSIAAAFFITHKRLTDSGQSASKHSSLEIGLLVAGLVAILVRICFQYLE